MEAQPERQPPQTAEQKEQFQYESRLQKKLAELAFPNEPVPLMAWAENTHGYSERFRAWREDPQHEDISLEDESSLQSLLTFLEGPTLH
jgi:hypothetical protein